ncbi:MAG TPA: guanylate kinase [Gemmatimonadaceae bacterium]|nr:guanylate kinase [Gemmatimonadaceae bacterium]
MSTFPVVLSAPSGAGKTTIVHALLKRRRDVGYSVSCTTRSPRPHEEDGRDYYFVSRAEFLERQKHGDFAESAEVHGNLYGTLCSEVDRVVKSGKHVLMDIDVQGAAQFRSAFPESVGVFVLPPSGEVLLARLRKRHTEDEAELGARLRAALHEVRAVEEYQYVVVNDDLEAAVQLVSSIIDAEVASRVRAADLRERVARLIQRLEQAIETHNQ